ncbi:MAG TPA: HEAT repeat domain-containing protein [Pirellulales bacterium]|jgi:HEAT repeat protein|nr:HEAT repeat domain-containing protein [Pirellulales bacterium]
MRHSLRWFALTAVVLACFASSAHAYIDLAPTLAKVIGESQNIAVVEVEKFSLEKGAVKLKKVSDLKGVLAAESFTHRVRKADGAPIEQPILEWAEPGRRAVLFVSGNTSLVCMGQGWYQVSSTGDGWAQLGASRPDLPLAYYGHISRLVAAIQTMLAHKTAIITTLPHNNDEQSDFDLPLNRQSLPGLVKLQRLRANLQMPPMVMAVSGNPAYVIGQGVAGTDEIGELVNKLHATDATVRAESASDLGSLGPKGAAGVAALTSLLDDQKPLVRFAAAAALLRIHGADEPAVKVLAVGLKAQDVYERRAAARAVGLAGAAASSLAKPLAALLADSDSLTSGAALQAISTLGPAAEAATDEVIPLLDRPELTNDAADALGRIGSAARPALKKLATLLKSDNLATRWAAVRAMSQIGGPDAAPAVDFMIKELQNASIVDGYNMMIYLALLGPEAKSAISAIQSTRTRMNPSLKPATIWAIDPAGRLPWQGGGGFGMMLGDADFGGWIYESYIRELGDRLRPTAITAARKIMDGTAGNVPVWGYKFLARFPGEALPILTAGLSSKELAEQERAAVALGYMGSVANSAKEQLEAALSAATDEREQHLLKWSLRQISAEKAE